MRRIGLLAFAVAFLSVAGTVYADPGDVAMPDSALEAAVEAIIGDDGVSGAVDGNWLVGDGASSAGAGANDPDGLATLGLDGGGDIDPVFGVTDLTGLAAATNLQLIILLGGDITSLTPLANLPALGVVGLFNCGLEDADVADLLGGTATIVALSLGNDDELPGTPNNITTTGVATIGGKASLAELGLNNQPSPLDISGLAGLTLGSTDVIGLGLDLSGTEISAGFDTIENFTGLKVLGLGECGLDQTEFGTVDWSLFTALEILFLTGNSITDLSPLATASTTLTTLDVSANPITANFDDIETFVNLNFLNLAGVPLGDAGLASIDWSLLTSLTILALDATDITDITPLTSLAVAGDLTITLFDNVLDEDSVCSDIPTLEASGYLVQQDIGVCGPLVVVQIDGTGAVSPDPQPQRVTNGSDVIYAAQPVDGSGFAFEGWYDTTGGAPGTLITADSTLSFNVTADVELTARFTNTGVNNLTVQLDGASTGTGTVDGVPGFGTFSYLTGTTLFLTAMPDVGSYFGGYSDDLSGFGFTQSITIDSDKTVTANFANTGFVVSVFAETLGGGGAPMGTTSPLPGDYRLVAGADFTVTAFPTDPAWRFVRWQDDSTTPIFQINNLQDDATVTAFFEETPDRTLTMIIDGNGSTTPAGAATPGNDYVFADGTPVTVSADADPGNVFVRWEGGLPAGVMATQPSFSFNISVDTTLTAVFEPGDTTLTILTPVGNGTTDPVPDTYDFLDFETATVTAIPNDALTAFDVWTGDVPAEAAELSTINLEMDVNRTITANFAAADHTLSLSLTGNGDINRATGDSGWLDGQVIDLAVIPVAGNDAFQGWYDVTGGAPGTLLSSEFIYSFAIMDDISIEARFITPEVTLEIVNANPGLGVVSPVAGVYGFLTGDVANLQAMPFPGNFFDGWTGDVVSDTPVIDVTMDSSKTVTANFDTTGFTVTLATTGMGNTFPPAGDYAVTDGAEFTATAQAFVANWVFDGWTAVGTTLADPSLETQTVTVSSDVTLTANFIEVVEPELTIEVQGNGTTSPPPGTTTRAVNEEVVITAIPGTGSAFTGWTGDIGDANPTDTTIAVIMDQDRTVTANFEEYDWFLTVQVTGTGTTSPLPGQYGHFEGDLVDLEAIEINGSGFVFMQWTGDIGAATATDAEITVTMDQNRVVTAVFEEPMEGAEGEGEGEGEGPACVQGPFHTADQNDNNMIALNELLRIIQFYNSGGFGCEDGTEDGYAPSDPDQDCCPHDSDYAPNHTPNWTISLSELLRLIQFYNSGGYNFCPLVGTEDNFCPGLL